MENIILFDDKSFKRLYPLTFTRPISEIRVGILSIREKWEMWLENKASHLTADHLQKKYPLKVRKRNLVINGSVLPNPQLCEEIIELRPGEALIDGETLIVAKFSDKEFEVLKTKRSISGFSHHPTRSEYLKINALWDIIALNGQAIRGDFDKITRGRQSETLSSSNMILAQKNIFVEAGANVKCAIINAEDGPVYIGANATIMEGAMIKGPAAFCEHSTIKMGAKIYPDTTIGPWSKAAGEISNSVITGYSNKGHDGYLGNSVLGEWCNIGADTNVSNLKNNYAEVRLWDYETGGFVPTGRQFLGLIMGDHSKCGINTMFNTGTVVGVSANIFGSGFPRNFIPSFTWGGPAGFTTYRIKKALEVVEIVMARRGMKLTEVEENILQAVYRMTSGYRRWE